MGRSLSALAAVILAAGGLLGAARADAAPAAHAPMTPIQRFAESDPYPPGCRNKRSFDACAIQGRGCDLGSRRACRQICQGLCDD